MAGASRRPGCRLVVAWILIGTSLAILQASPAQAAVVQLGPGDDIQAAVDTYAEGTIFTLAAGVYRHQQVTPRNNQVFIGQGAETILTGATTLTDWKRRRGKLWYVAGQTQQGQVHGECEGGWTRCNRPEDLFVDGVAFQHVGSTGQLGPGRWFFDYNADRIYIGEDPSGHLVETSVTRHAFLGDADNVTISNLVVEKYAVPAQHGAIDSRTSNIGSHGSTWTIDGVEGRLNHGGAVYLTSGGRLINSYLHHNGQQAMSATGSGLIVEDNEFSFNNTAHFRLDWEGGASKFWRTTDLVFRSNHSHENYGTGVWVDYENENTLIENNTVERNYREGIYVEVSLSATVRDNYVEGNGLDDPRGDSWLWSGGITVASSRNVEVVGNILVNNGNGITATQQNRGSGTGGPWLVENLNVHDNDVTMFEGQTGIVQDVGDHAVFVSRNNRFENNTYRGDGQARLFAWMDTSHTFPEWRAQFDHDWGGRLVSSTGDLVAPVLSLLGSDPLLLDVNDPFLDPGATVIDNFDARAVAFTSDTVNTAVAGEYVVSYTAIDSNGNTATPVLRTVLVVGAGLPLVTVVAVADAAEEGTVAGRFLLTRTGDTSAALPVSVELSGSATAALDYVAPNSPFEIPAGTSGVEIVITPLDDSEPEDPETVTMTVQPGPGYSVGTPAAGTLTIADNDPPLPSVTVTAEADAAETGPTAGSFLVARSGDTSETLTVDLTGAGTATPGDDYAPLPPSVVFPVGVAGVAVPVQPVNDTENEGHETVVLTLVPGAGYSVADPATAVVTIADNDAPTNFVAVAEATSKGSVTTGSYLNTHVSDDVVEVLTEEVYGGGKRSRLEHRWTFTLGADGPATFYAEAFRTDGRDTFALEYSLDGSAWTTMAEVTAIADNGTVLSYPLPAGAIDIVVVRAIDTDRSRNDGTADELVIDWMTITLD